MKIEKEKKVFEVVYDVVGSKKSNIVFSRTLMGAIKKAQRVGLRIKTIKDLELWR